MTRISTSTDLGYSAPISWFPAVILTSIILWIIARTTNNLLRRCDLSFPIGSHIITNTTYDQNYLDTAAFIALDSKLAARVLGLLLHGSWLGTNCWCPFCDWNYVGRHSFCKTITRNQNTVCKKKSLFSIYEQPEEQNRTARTQWHQLNALFVNSFAKWRHVMIWSLNARSGGRYSLPLEPPGD